MAAPLLQLAPVDLNRALLAIAAGPSQPPTPHTNELIADGHENIRNSGGKLNVVLTPGQGTLNFSTLANVALTITGETCFAPPWQFVSLPTTHSSEYER